MNRHGSPFGRAVLQCSNDLEARAYTERLARRQGAGSRGGAETRSAAAAIVINVAAGSKVGD